jgi:hypothetical protein
MSKYVDYKAIVWGRLYFSDDTNMNKVIEKLEQGALPSDLCDDLDLGFQEFEFLFDTEEYMSPSENQDCHTIEVYENINDSEFWQECIWDNVNKRKQY